MDQFKLFEDKGIPIEEQPMSWEKMIKDPYDKDTVDAYTKARVILLNGVGNNALLSSHAMARERSVTIRLSTVTPGTS